MKKILFILLLNFNLTFCQIKEATIIFNDSTSIKGFGEIKKNKIYFKVEEKDEISEWSSDIAMGITFSSYGYSEKYEYVRFDINRKPILMQVIEEGDVNLYLDVFLTNGVNFFDNTWNPLFNNTAQRYNNSLNLFSTTIDSNLKKEYFTKRKNEEIATNISANFSKKAIKYFEDCGVLVNKIKTGKYRKDKIEEIIAYYNNYCFEDEIDTDDKP